MLGLGAGLCSLALGLEPGPSWVGAGPQQSWEGEGSMSKPDGPGGAEAAADHEEAHGCCQASRLHTLPRNKLCLCSRGGRARSSPRA